MKNEIVEPQTGEKYRHFKGESHVYEIISLPIDANRNDGRHSVLYKSLFDGKRPQGTEFTSSLERFCGYKLNIWKLRRVKRFTKI